MDTESFDAHAHLAMLMKKEDTTQEDIKKAYSLWSKTYEKDLLNEEYIGPVVAAEQLAQKLKEFGYPNDARILDLGCGTGLVGEELVKCGYKNIDGVDLTPELLEVAKAKGIYGLLQQGTMGSPGCKDLGIGINQYDAAICVGTFTIKHVNSEGFDDLVHVVKPGGLACFVVREICWEDPSYGYVAKMDELCEAKKWKLLEKKYIEKYTAKNAGWLFCCQML